MRNLAISLPQLNEHSEDAMMSRLGYPDCVPVIARNPAEQSISFPAYITSPVSLVDYLTEAKSPVIVEPLCVKIMDFGNCEIYSTPLALTQNSCHQHFGNEGTDLLLILPYLSAHLKSLSANFLEVKLGLIGTVPRTYGQLPAQ